MSLRRIALPSLLALLAVPHAWAYDDDKEPYDAEVCNAGQIAFDVAVAYKDWGSGDPSWMVSYWTHIAAGECENVFSHRYLSNFMFRRETFPLHLAFAFTDSRGVWGAAVVGTPTDKDDVAESHVKLCVGREDFEYRVDDQKNPQVTCPNTAGGHTMNLLIPASFVWEPTQGRRWNPLLGIYGPPARFTVKLVSADRAFVLGPRGPKTVTTENASDMEDFVRVIRDAVNAIPSQEEIHNADGSRWLMPGYRWVGVCAEREVVYKGSLSGLQTPRARVIRAGLHGYLAAHPNGTVRLEVTDSDGLTLAEPLAGNFGDCVDRGLTEYKLQSPEGPGAPDGSPQLQLLSVINEALLGPGAPVPIRATPVGHVGVCIADPNSKVAAWGGKQSAKATAFKAALRQYVSTHRFKDRVGPAVIRVTDAGDGFTLGEVEGYCPTGELFTVTVAKV